MTTTHTPIDPESLVARIMEELRANPAAQRLLMQALLTREFQGMPLRLEHIEAQLDDMLGRVKSLEEVQRDLQNTVRDIQDKVGSLIGDTFELKLPGRIIPLLSQKIRLRKAEVVLSPTTSLSHELADAIADAVDAGVFDERQERRIGLTDIIIRAQRRVERSAVWVAVEASSAIHLRDIERARQSADALAAAFRQDAIAVVVGNRIGSDESRQAADAGVEVLVVE
ncbi:MAG: hypothetical protein F4Y44_02135 [Chloroflexi bacterium]|nr:hypothetical protein [Chloroflexota bacterium]